MKLRSFILLAGVLLFSSCLVKSLNPFYTKETISFDTQFIGTWKSKGDGKWVVESIKDKVLKENNVTRIEDLSKSDKEMYDRYKGAYFVTIKGDGQEANFLVMPFKVKDQLFLDFTPVVIESELNSLLQNHLAKTHSLVKFDVLQDGKVSLKWFDEKRIKDLFKNNKIKIKHEKIIGFLFEEEILLTAKPKELQKFIKKYMSSNQENKWKTDTKYTLTRDTTKP